MQCVGFIIMSIFKFGKCTRCYAMKCLTVPVTNFIQGLVEGKPVTVFHQRKSFLHDI